ncbi:MAG: hypothetical protein WBA02_08555 [Jannaschia helgolandensis]|uniref:Sigma-70, region 4 n=1 Tax=Jannaschia helgolandensis TaxID=188906 RepID=A0A1H7LSZ5_9RHOB|nr:hypothetical protein [Jannaschia helgolandensis]SEL02104.1 hypothetical protein SAMN04488526_1819 [Jannaschia helgolandensis]
MTDVKRSCSGFDRAELSDDEELRAILDALFCTCIEDLSTQDTLQHSDLFRLAEIEGQALPDAARALGLDVEEAERMLTKTRREMALLLVLGLCKPSSAAQSAEAQFRRCRCKTI